MQKKVAGKRNRNSDNNYSASEGYLQYLKYNVLGQKSQRSIPTTDIVGEVTNKSNQTSFILIALSQR
jgi:hypothetical protein